MARRRGARRLTHPSGVARAIDGVSDVGPSSTPMSSVPPAAAPAPAGETLEDRQERWFRERARRRAALAPTPP